MSDPTTWRTAANVFTGVAFVYCLLLLLLSLARAGGLPVPWWRVAAALATVLLGMALVIVLGAAWAAFR